MEQSGIPDRQWDIICRRCGECCFEKIEDERGNILYTRTACRYLDVNSRRCKIFKRRFEINPGCVKLTPELVQSLRWLPRDCGYRLECLHADEPGERGTKNTRKRKVGNS
ncbi:MAG: YkgJ family cysteine cluster protein [Desulfuromonadales bacterium]